MTNPEAYRDNDRDNDGRSVDEYGDDYGLRGEAEQSSTVIVAVRVHRKGSKTATQTGNGGKGLPPSSSCRKQAMDAGSGGRQSFGAGRRSLRSA